MQCPSEVAGVPCSSGSDWCGLCPWKLRVGSSSPPPKIVSPQYLSLLESARIALRSLLLRTQVLHLSMVNFPFLLSQQVHVLLQEETPGRLFTILHMILSFLYPSFQTFKHVPFRSIQIQAISPICHDYRISSLLQVFLRILGDL